VLRPGNVLICDADTPFARRFPRGLEELVVKVPRTAFGAGLSHPVVAASGGSRYASALAKLAARATRAEHPVRPDERTLLELVTVLAAGPHAAPQAAHHAAACAFIEDQLTDPGLGAGWVAAAIGVSERQLSRVFAAGGTSVPRYILLRRLELAHAMLASGGSTVADVAASCGFVSARYFSHVFRQHYGQRAGDILREAVRPL
jgi:AraC-like DNA-binding protein